MQNFAEKMKGLLDSEAPFTIFNLYGIKISTVVMTTWIIMLIIFILILFITKNLSLIPKNRNQIIAEKIVQFFREFTVDLVGNKAKEMISLLGSIFITIFCMNFIWFIPILHPPTATYSTTSALAVTAFMSAQYIIIRKKGLFSYIKSFSHPFFFMIFFNLIDLITRPLALSVRLFGNLFTGGILLGVVYAAIPFLLPLPFHALEMLTGTIQSYVFALLIGIYAREGLE